jgi:hypothetical protein
MSLNDCPIKGPEVLADRKYIVRLGMGCHWMAFTTDISKFCQCLEADNVMQHL